MIYGDKFFKRRYSKYHDNEVALAKKWYDYFKPERVVDLGCGIGSYLCGFQECGADVSGIEYGFDYALPYIPDEVEYCISYGDLTVPVWHVGTHDLVISIEVAEHLPESAADAFCANVVSFAEKNILITAAGIGQAGMGHINLQHKDYWIKRMENEGAKYSAEKTADVQEITGDVLNIAKNMMVFVI